MTKTLSLLRDPELIEMLADDPELLAIADALVETRREAPSTRRRQLLQQRRRLASVGAAATVAAAAVAVLLVAPWNGRGGLVERALAAIGQGPVLHVVTEQSSPYGWYKPVSLPSGTPIKVTQRQEIWFDQTRDLKKTVTTLNGVVYDQLLETPQGGFTPDGPVFTCAWIAAHPVEATKARVSCNANMQNGTTPHKVPEQPPTLDLALAGFLDHYQSALASGQATKTGSGQIDGRNVIWLRINTAADGVGGYPAEEEVAIDASTYAPALVRTVGAQTVQFSVEQIDTQSYEPSLFTQPAREYPPTIGQTEGTSQIDLTQAPALLGGKALWLGQTWQGFRLVKVERQQMMTGYGPLSGKQPTHSVGVVFTYAPPGGSADSRDVLQIKEATQCELAWAMSCGAGSGRINPSEGVLVLGQPFFSSTTLRDGLYIAISQNGSQSDPVTIADALQPLEATTK